MWTKFLDDTKLDLRYDKWLDSVNKNNIFYDVNKLVRQQVDRIQNFINLCICS